MKYDNSIYNPLVKGLEKDSISNCTRISKILMNHFLGQYLKKGFENVSIPKSQLKDMKGSLEHLADVLCDKRFLTKTANGRLKAGPKLLTRLERAKNELGLIKKEYTKAEKAMAIFIIQSTGVKGGEQVDLSEKNVINTIEMFSC